MSGNSEDINKDVITAIERVYGNDAYMFVTRAAVAPNALSHVTLGKPCSVAVGKVSADDALGMLFAVLGVMQSIYGHSFTEVALAGAVLAYSTTSDICEAANRLIEKQKKTL